MVSHSIKYLPILRLCAVVFGKASCVEYAPNASYAIKTPNGNTKAFSTFKEIFKAGFIEVNKVLLTLGLIIVFLAFFTNMQEEVPLAGIADDRIRQSSMTVGVIGIIIIGTAIFGFIGVNRSVMFFTGIYMLCLGMAALSFVALGVYIVTNAVDLRKTVKENVKVKMEAYTTSNETKIEIDALQEKFECCGIQGSKSNVEVFGSHPIPKSCCEEGTPTCTVTKVYKDGCDIKVERKLELLSYPLGGASFGCAIYSMVVTVLAGVVKKPDN